MSSSVDQADDVAVFVDHEREATARALELRQLLRERRALGYEVGLACRGELAQPLVGKTAARELLCDALHMQDADDVVELLLVDRQARVRRRCAAARGCPPSSTPDRWRRFPGAGS